MLRLHKDSDCCSMVADAFKTQTAVAMVQHSILELGTSVQAAVHESMRQ